MISRQCEMKGARMYEEQVQRLERWFERFAEFKEGTLDKPSSDYYMDIVHAFFQNCHHLKDWINNDPGVEIAKETVEEWISSKVELKICADICNSTKHLKLNNVRSGTTPTIGKAHYTFHTHEGTTSLTFTVDTASGPEDAFELATRCMEAWRQFIKDRV